MKDEVEKPAPTTRRPSAAELRKLPMEERNAILEAQAALAEHEYCNDPRLTDFEAFEEDEW